MGLPGSDVQLMTEPLRHGLRAEIPAATLAGEVELDEVSVVAGHQGQPAAVATGGLVYTDGYAIDARLERWGYRREAVRHGRGETARGADGDGFGEVHVDTLEGFWSWLRSWLRPPRGIPSEKPPRQLGFFQFVHHAAAAAKPCSANRSPPGWHDAPTIQHPGSRNEPRRICSISTPSRRLSLLSCRACRLSLRRCKARSTERASSCSSTKATLGPTPIALDT
jgi:hypothetical protein